MGSSLAAFMMRATRMSTTLAYALIVVIGVAAEDSLTNGVPLVPEKKLISTFQIVRFPNDACVGTNSRNGTCYTSAECSDKGGASSGSCADGFGVCCTFLVSTCGSSSSENITYWSTPTTVTAGAACSLNLCPVSTNICQLRIDFLTFTITGPSTASISENHTQFGVQPSSQKGTTAGTGMNWATGCFADSFSVSSKSISNSPPTICGTNSGHHMYVDANVEDCNVLQFNIGVGAAGAEGVNDNKGITAKVTPKWDLTVYQYECGAINAAPPGCTQYLFGPITGKITSYNYDANTVHLANQNQKICIRRERNYCWNCFATDGVAITFQIGGTNAIAAAFTYPTQPCGYNAEADNGLGNTDNEAPGYDCAIIPDAFTVGDANTGVIIAAETTAANIRTNTQALANVGAPPQITGHTKFGIGGADGVALNAITVAGGAGPFSLCTNHIPFQLTFKSDHFEGTGKDGERGDFAAANAQRGFSINYEQIKCAA